MKKKQFSWENQTPVTSQIVKVMNSQNLKTADSNNIFQCLHQLVSSL